MSDDQEQDGGLPPESLLPYDDWTEDALRGVVLRALDYAAKNGLPGGHHFYITFRTDLPGVVIPARLRERFPQEMTIVLQHQFWDLKVDHATASFSVGLSFGGVPSTLGVPLSAVTGFADPHIRGGWRAGDADSRPPRPCPACARLARRGAARRGEAWSGEARGGEAGGGPAGRLPRRLPPAHAQGLRAPP